MIESRYFSWVLLGTLAVLVASAAGAADEIFVIPGAAHTDGVGGSRWRSDLSLSNPSTQPLAGNYVFCPYGTDNTSLANGAGTPFTIAGNGSLSIDDVTAAHPEQAGLIWLRASGPLVGGVRTYSESSSGTFGQWIPATSLPSDTQFTIPDVGASRARRTNMGLVNSSAAPITFDVRLVGSTAAKSFTVLPYSAFQGELFASLGSPPVEAGTLTITSSARGGFPYVSIVDNDTNDPTYFYGSVGLATRSTNGLAVTHLFGVGNTDGAAGSVWRSRLVLYNPALSALAFDVSFLVASTSNLSTSPTRITVGARETKVIDDAIGTLFPSLKGNVGTLRVSADTDVFHAIARTYNLAATGSFGQSINARAPQTGALRLAGLSGSTDPSAGFRSNLGVFSARNTAQTINVRIFDRAGALRKSESWTVPANGSVQYEVFSKTGLTPFEGGSATVEGDQLIAYLSVIDNRTNDASTVDASREGVCPGGFSGPDCTFCTWTSAGSACQPLTPRNLIDVGTIKELSLAELGWTLKGTSKVPGVTIYTGDWSGGIFPAYDIQGAPIDLTLREAAAVYVPDGYPESAHPGLGLVYAAHYTTNIDSAAAVTIARYFGIPVLYHGEYPNWLDAGYPSREAISKASAVHLARENPCNPEDLIRGVFVVAMAKTDMRAITLLQRLAEQAGGQVRKVALRGFSKEGGAAWLAFQMDDRIEVGIPGGAQGEDRIGSAQFEVKACGCEPGSPTQEDIQNTANGLAWRLGTPAGAAATNLYSTAENLPLLYPRVLLIDGDVGMLNMHDGAHGQVAGEESGFLDSLTNRPWRYVRKATVQQGAGGEDGDVTSTAAVPTLGAELLVSGPGSEQTLYPDISNASATMTGDSFVVTATASAATAFARVWWTWSTDRVFNDPTQEPWHSVPMTTTGGGIWTSSAIAVPPGRVIAWYAEVGNTVTIEGTERSRTHAAPIRMLRPSPDKVCAPEPASFCEAPG